MTSLAMEGFLHHMAPQFLHPALQGFGCGAFRPIGGAFHPLYPGKAFARHLGEQYALGQSVGQALRSVRDDTSTPPLYRHGYGARDDTSSPGSAASASPRPCKEDEPTPPQCTDSHDFFSPDGERKSSCGVCGARLGPGVAQAHFLQELQHLYSLSALPREPAAPPPHPHHHQDEDARWETYQRIRANRQRRLKLRTRKRHHTVESMLGYELDDDTPRRPEDRPVYDTEDEPVDVEGDSLGWPDANIHVEDKEQPRQETEKPHASYSEDLEISSTNDNLQGPDRMRMETPKPLSLECPTKLPEGPERPADVTTSEPWPASVAGATPLAPPADTWPALADPYLHVTRHKLDGENQPSSTDSRN
ncbi:protein Teyrha-meyrha isoform X1 [Plutella xylostella]|uniref:protein Teyrha-meyrha isoform X1 n=2 Tax=Plutella xylostella TaxID=51655 RepID=UPI0020325EFE|nr:protein Teyrha-meyrha isoform X1 [Plutella xylostella]